MSLKQQIEKIKKEISEKDSQEWKGLQTTTEKQLESLAWYLDHPKMEDRPALQKEVVDLYLNAKLSNFTKMESIIRKLDQLSITLGKYDYSKKEEVEKKKKFTNYVQEIKDLRAKAESLMHTPYGKSLPEKTQESIIKFINYLNYPNLHLKQTLFDEMYEKYEVAENNEFMQMQRFNDMLNKLEIKLGEVTESMKKFKTLKEQKEELEKARKEVEQERMSFRDKIKELEKEREQIQKEKEKLEREKKRLKEEKEDLKASKTELEHSKIQFEEQKKELDYKWKKVQEFSQKFQENNDS